MTDFKYGDRVRGIYSGKHGTVRKGYYTSRAVWVEWDGGSCPVVVHSQYLSKVTPRPLVGPAPKVDAPIVQTPFAYDEENFEITDATGRPVLSVLLLESEFGELTDDEFRGIGKWFAAALNNRAL